MTMLENSVGFDHGSLVGFSRSRRQGMDQVTNRLQSYMSAFLKYCSICLRHPPIQWPHPIVHTPPPPPARTLIHSGKRGRANQREGYWGNKTQSRSKIPT
jgi:hypothetical protein